MHQNPLSKCFDGDPVASRVDLLTQLDYTLIAGQRCLFKGRPGPGRPIDKFSSPGPTFLAQEVGARILVGRFARFLRFKDNGLCVEVFAFDDPGTSARFLLAELSVL